ncbi:MAG: fibronectin type III domain-containing protein, partial [Eubacterium sp.]|nr:fibronectin type III domain-containing protein [Eubacterium sp.]MBR0412773.1 fibronectin type III domain-containing protein [Eubacterium sp.]
MKTKRLLSIFLAIIMMFSAACSLNMTAFAEKTYTNQTAVKLCTIKGTIDSSITAINTERFTVGHYGCLEVHITSDTAINYSLTKNSSDSDNPAIVKADVTNSRAYLWGAKGTYVLTLSKGTKSFGKTANYIITVYNRTPQTTIKKITAKKKALTLTWQKKSGVSGYQIQYATNKKFTKAKKIDIKNANTTSRTIKKLAANKRYYVRIRTCKADDSHREFSKWSAVKTIKTK